MLSTSINNSTTIKTIILNFQDLIKYQKALAAMNGIQLTTWQALKAGISSTTKAMVAWMATNPIGWFTLLAGATVGTALVLKQFNTTLDDAGKTLSEQNEKFKSLSDEVTSLSDELETATKRIEELEALPSLTIVEDEELQKLKDTTAELEYQLAIKKEEQRIEAEKTAKAANDAYNASYQRMYDGNGELITSPTNENWNPVQELKNTMKAYEVYKKSYDELQAKITQDSEAGEDTSKDQKRLANIKKQMTSIEEHAKEMADVINDQKEAYEGLYAAGFDVQGNDLAIYEEVRGGTEAYREFCNTLNDTTKAYSELSNEEKRQSILSKAVLGGKTKEEAQKIVDSISDEDLEFVGQIHFNRDSSIKSVHDEIDAIKSEASSYTDGNETSILSFSQAWEDLKNSTEDATKTLADDLTELAESGQLSLEAFSETDSTDYFKNLGISAEEATKQINALVSASTQLNALSAQISKMSDMLADKKNGTTASASDLAGFDAEVRGLDSWTEFEKVMGSTTSTMEECQAAANALASEWINNGNFLANLTEQNRDYYENQLKNMGIENAHVIILENLAKAGYELSDAEQAELDKAIQAREEIYALQLQEAQDFIAKKDLNVAAQDAYAGLLQEAEGAGISKVALIDLIAQEQVFNNSGLSVSSKISELSALASAYLGTAAAAQFAANTSVSGMGSDSRYFTPDYVMDQWTGALSNYKVNFDISSSGSSGYKGSSSKSSGSSSKDTKQTIDWIERKLDVLQKKIDATKAKFENLFTLKDKKNNLNEQIKLTNSLLNTTNKAAERYLKAAKGVKLSSDLKKKVQNGAYDITEYGDKTAQNIQKYQNYIDKYNELIKQADTLNTDIRNLKSERYQLYIDDADARTNRYETLMDGTASTGKRISYLKKSKKTISTSYKNKIKQAINDGNYVEASTLRAEWKNALKDNTISQYQERADKADKKAAKSQALATLDEGNYKKQNKHLESQKKSLRESYNWQIKIAEKQGDILEVDRLRAEKQKELNDLTMQEFENIDATYSMKIGHTDNKTKAFQDQISLLEARGEDVGSRLYTKQMELNQVNINRLQKEYEDQVAEAAKFDFGTPEWYKAQDAIANTTSKIVNYQIEQANLQKSINQLKFDRFDDLLAKLNDIVDETDFLIDMLDSENFFDDNGKITDDGITAMGMYAQKRDIYKSEAEKYKQMQAELEQMYANGDIGIIDYEAKMREYKSGQMDMTKAAEDMNKSIINLVSDGLEKQNQALSESIQKQKDLLRAEKDLKSFQDSLNDANKNVSRLERQYEILQGDDSEENRKRLREIKSQLEDAKKSRDDLLYDKSIEDTEKNLDDMYDAAVKNSEEYLSDSAKVLIDACGLVNTNTETVSKNIERISKETGVDISKNITNAWKQSGNAVSDFGTTVSSTMPGVLNQISLVTEQMRKLAEESEKAGKAIVNATEGKYTSYGAGGSGKTTNPKEDEYNNYQLQKQIGNYLLDNTKDAKGDPKSYSSLNRYIYEKTGKILPEDKQAGLAKILGITGIGKDTSADDRAKILKALKSAGFSSGGVIDAKSLIRQTGEDGIALVKHEEAVLTKPEWQSIRDLGIALTNMNQQIYKPYIPEFQTRNVQPISNNININTTVEGVATDKIVKDFENVATKSVEKAFSKVNNMAYAKGVRRK